MSRALTLLHTLLARNPDAHRCRAKLNVGLGNYSEALRDHLALLDCAPHDQTALLFLIGHFREQENFDVALSHADTLCSVIPQDLHARMIRAQLLKDLQRLPESFFSFTVVIEEIQQRKKSLSEKENDILLACCLGRASVYIAYSLISNALDDLALVLSVRIYHHSSSFCNLYILTCVDIR